MDENKYRGAFELKEREYNNPVFNAKNWQHNVLQCFAPDAICYTDSDGLVFITTLNGSWKFFKNNCHLLILTAYLIELS